MKITGIAFCVAILSFSIARAQGVDPSMACNIIKEQIDQRLRISNSALGSISSVGEILGTMAGHLHTLDGELQRLAPDAPQEVRVAIARIIDSYTSYAAVLRLLETPRSNVVNAGQELTRALTQCSGAQQTDRVIAQTQIQAARSISLAVLNVDRSEAGLPRAWLRLTNISPARRASLGAHCVFFRDGIPFGEGEGFATGDFAPQAAATVSVFGRSAGQATTAECQPR